VGPRAGLDTVEKRNIPAPARNRTLAVQSVAHRYTDRSILAPYLRLTLDDSFVEG
jgi:hypothetical protein